jgi:hypothetical protein
MKPSSILAFGTIVSLFMGGTMGFILGWYSCKQPDKPIEVCTSDKYYLRYMDVDSVVGNKAYNDGLSIELKDVLYIKFK